MRPHRRSQAFSLMEVLVAIALLAVVSVLVWSTLARTFITKRQIEAGANRYNTVRVALNRIAREISQAFLSLNEDRTQAERRTRFVAKSQSDVDELTFSYLGHLRLYADAKEADSALVKYTGRRNPQTGQLDLIRLETRRLSNQKPEIAAHETDIVCDDIVSLQLRFWDPQKKEFVDHWDSTAIAGQPDRLPSRVKITLTVHDERGKEVPFMTETRIAMQEPLDGTAKAEMVAPAR